MILKFFPWSNYKSTHLSRFRFLNAMFVVIILCTINENCIFQISFGFILDEYISIIIINFY